MNKINPANKGNPMLDQMNSLNLNNNPMMKQIKIIKRENPILDKMNLFNLNKNLNMMNQMNNCILMTNRKNFSNLNNNQVVNPININNQMMNQNNNQINNQNMNIQNYNLNNQMINQNNYNLNNQNMNNPINPIYNSEFIKKTKELYDLYGRKNNLIQNNMIAFRQNENSQLERLPRNKNVNQYYNNSFHHINDSKYNFNINFTTASGYSTILTVDHNIKVYDLLTKYMKKINLSPSLIGNGLYFIYNGSKIKNDDYNRLIKDFFKKNSSIIVIDSGNLIGG